MIEQWGNIYEPKNSLLQRINCLLLEIRQKAKGNLLSIFIQDCINTIEMDSTRLFTVKARATIVRDYLFKGGDLYVVYPREGLHQRIEEQQTIYKQELMNFPTHLFDIPLNCETMPTDLIGATYFFHDQSGKIFVFAIKMTQAKDPKALGNFGLWFGPIDAPSIQKRVKTISSYLEEKGVNVLRDNHLQEM